MWIDVRTAFLFVIIALHQQLCALPHPTGSSKNVLLLISDDMRPETRAYGAQHMVTPNLDRLASRSAVFRRAYVQQAVCSPSCTSMLTGRRPDTTCVTDLYHYWRQVGGNFTTLPEYFKQHGYKTAGIGKVYTICSHTSTATFISELLCWKLKAYTYVGYTVCVHLRWLKYSYAIYSMYAFFCVLVLLVL